VKKVLSIRLDGNLVMLPVSIMALPSKKKKVDKPIPPPAPIVKASVQMAKVASSDRTSELAKATPARVLKEMAPRPTNQASQGNVVKAKPVSRKRGAFLKNESFRKKARYRVTAGCLDLMIPFYVTRTVHDLCHEVTIRVRRHRLYPKLIEDINSKLHPSDQRRNLRVSQLSREKGGQPLNLLNAIGLSVEPDSSLHATLVAVTH